MNGDCTDLSPHNLAELKNDRKPYRTFLRSRSQIFSITEEKVR